MGSPETDALKSAFSIATLWNERATILVAVGVVVEFAALLLFSKEMPARERFALFVGNVLVIVGVGGEWIFEGRAADAAAQLQQVSDQRVAALQREQAADHKTAAQAAAYAASLGVTVEKLPNLVNGKLAVVDRQYAILKTGVDAETKRDTTLIAQFDKDKKTFDTARNDALASAAKAEAAVATINRAEADIATALNSVQNMRQRVTEIITPRTIDDAHFSALVTSLKRFPKTPIDFAMTRDVECLDLLVRVTDAVKAAGWTIQPWWNAGLDSLNVSSRPDLPAIGQVTGRTVQITVAGSDLKTLQPAGDALIASLRDAGIAVNAFHVDDKLPDGKPNPQAEKPGAVHVVVGVKP